MPFVIENTTVYIIRINLADQETSENRLQNYIFTNKSHVQLNERVNKTLTDKTALSLFLNINQSV